MSADNYIAVRRFDDGWWWAMGFASAGWDRLPDSEFVHGPFVSKDDCVWDASKKCSVIEYGFFDDEEVSPE